MRDGHIVCPIGSTGARLCSITVPQMPPGTSTNVDFVVQVANPLPDDTQQIQNYVTDNVVSPSIPGCSTSNAPCSPAPACDPVGDPNHCVVRPVLRSSEVSVTKTNTPTAGPSDQAADTVSAGTTTTYTVVVTNNGPDAVSGVALSDTPAAGLDCPTTNPVTCTSTATPSACPVGALTIGHLQSGVTLGNLPAAAPNNSATFSFTCNVQP